MSILIRPIVTEKVSNQNNKRKYGFIVNKYSNKIEIKKEIEGYYNVQVESVNTIFYSGKNKDKSTKTKIMKGKTFTFKKAIVTLTEGNIIDFYSEK